MRPTALTPAPRSRRRACPADELDEYDPNVTRLGEQLDRLIADVYDSLRSRPSTWTWVVAVAALIGGVIEAVLSLAGPAGGLITAVTLSAGFLVRRVWPAVALVLIIVPTALVDVIAAIANQPVELSFGAAIMAIATIYGLARYAPARIVVILAGLAIVAIPLISTLNPVDDGDGLGWVAGEALGNAAIIGLALVLRATAANRHERKLLAEANERNQLANEIHDSVAHHMSAIAIRAESALHQSQDPAVIEALGAIKKSASTGLSDMRHLVNELRDKHRRGTTAPRARRYSPTCCRVQHHAPHGPGHD